MRPELVLAQAALILAAPKVKEPKPPKSDSPWMDKHGFTQDVLNNNALAWWDRMTPQQQHEAQYWYPVYHEWATEMAARRGIHPHKGPGVVAATSPLRRWDGNLQDAHNILTHYPHAPENIKKPPGLSAAANVKRAQRVFDAPDDPAAIRAALSESKDPNSAKKILNFHDLGVNPEHGGAFNYAQQPVVIDSWMPRGILVHPDAAEQYNSEDLNLVPETLRDRKVKKVRKQNPMTGEWEDTGYRDPNLRDVGIWALSNKGGYDRMANALRYVAQQRNLPFAHIAQAGIWNRLGGTANPDGMGDHVAEHPEGPLTHIQDPHALYNTMWSRQVNKPPAQPKALQPVAFARGEDFHVDEDWDHQATPHTKLHLDVAHGRLPHIPEGEEEEERRRQQIIDDAKILLSSIPLLAVPKDPSAQWGADVMRSLTRQPGPPGDRQRQYPGVTVRENPGDAPSSGYMVSLPHAEQEQSYSQLNPGQINDYVRQHADEINSHPDNYYGGWGDESGETPRYYHDISRNIQDPWEAAGNALQWNQKAVYDVAQGEAPSTPEFWHDQIAKGGRRHT